MERDNLEREHEIEDRALKLGEERSAIRQRLDENSERIAELVSAAPESIPLKRLARLTGVSRATLYRWMEG